MPEQNPTGPTTEVTLGANNNERSTGFRRGFVAVGLAGVGLLGAGFASGGQGEAMPVVAPFAADGGSNEAFSFYEECRDGNQEVVVVSAIQGDAFIELTLPSGDVASATIQEGDSGPTPAGPKGANVSYTITSGEFEVSGVADACDEVVTEPTDAPTEPTDAPTEPTDAPTEPTEKPGQEVCPDNEVHDGIKYETKVDTNGNPESVTITAPEGFLIGGYCIKAGDDLDFVDVPDAETVVITDQDDDKAVSHFSPFLVKIEEPTETTEGPTETTDGPTETTEGSTPTTEGPTETTDGSTETTTVTTVAVGEVTPEATVLTGATK
ncbi:MAG: hypothetical protein M3Q79_03360 [bacterium]|nr:hypothetical protein [bacterium]